jgi:large subunit ribosomal protein L4
MKANVIDIKGKEGNQIELNNYVFNIVPNRAAIYEAIKNELANKRHGTHSTKTKGEVQGSGAKPWKQKGTGRARVGTKRNPVWTGGGIAFGPKPRDYSYTLPKKVKRLAIRSILSLKNRKGKIKVIENFKIENGKTKEIKLIFSPLFNNVRSSLILSENENSILIKRAGKNLPWLNCLSYNRLSAHKLFYSEYIAITEDAINGLNTFFKEKKKD